MKLLIFLLFFILCCQFVAASPLAQATTSVVVNEPSIPPKPHHGGNGHVYTAPELPNVTVYHPPKNITIPVENKTQPIIQENKTTPIEQIKQIILHWQFTAILLACLLLGSIVILKHNLSEEMNNGMDGNSSENI